MIAAFLLGLLEDRFALDAISASSLHHVVAQFHKSLFPLFPSPPSVMTCPCFLSSPAPDLERGGSPAAAPKPQSSPKPQDITTAGDNNTAQSEASTGGGGGCKRIIKKPSFCPLLNSAQLNCARSGSAPLSPPPLPSLSFFYLAENISSSCASFAKDISFLPHSAKETISSKSAISIPSEAFNIWRCSRLSYG